MEKFLLGDDWAQSVEAAEQEQAERVPQEEGILTSLERLDRHGEAASERASARIAAKGNFFEY